MEIQFYLNANGKKTTSAHPDYRGKVVINGEPHQLAGWIKNGQYGESISVKLTPDTYKKDGGLPIKNQPIADEEIPF
jgi:uncharacterized protein (DUF736 family)